MKWTRTTTTPAAIAATPNCDAVRRRSRDERQGARGHGERQRREQRREEPDLVADAGDVRRGAADALAQQGDAARALDLRGQLRAERLQRLPATVPTSTR